MAPKGHNASHLSPLADVPASGLIVLWVKVSMMFLLGLEIFCLCSRCAAGYSGNPLLGQRCTVGNNEVNGTCDIVQTFTHCLSFFPTCPQTQLVPYYCLQVTATTVTSEEVKAAVEAFVAAR